jgi:hypothetical protein
MLRLRPCANILSVQPRKIHYRGTSPHRAAAAACPEPRRTRCPVERSSPCSTPENAKTNHPDLPINALFIEALAINVLALSLLTLTVSCGSSGSFHRTQSFSSSNQQQLPFHPGVEQSSDDTSRPKVPAAQDTPHNSKLFIATSRSHTIPTGTLVTIRLQDPLLLSRIHAGDGFSGSVADPLVVDGDALVENGDLVTGRIESTQPPPLSQSCRGPAPGYVRLSLSTITVDGTPIPLQTLSLFAKAIGQATTPQACEFQLQKGHLLTFRLSAPLTIAQSQALAKLKP